MSDTTLAMSDEPVLSPTSAANTSPSNSSTLASAKGLNLSSSTTKDYPDQSNSPDLMYKNNNNNNNIEDSVSPPSRDVVTNFSIESHLLGAEDSNSNHHNKQMFKRRDSFNSDECKMNISPKERERTLSTVMEEDQEEMNMQYSPKSGAYPPSGGESGGLSKFSQDDGVDYSQPHHLAATLQQKRPIFNEGADLRDHHQQSLQQHSHSDYDRVNHEGHHLQQSRGGIPHHDFMREQDQNEEMSENEEEMVCDDYESDSDTNEPRITVREALMNRALAAAAAAAAAAGSTSAASHFAAAAGERSELFASEQGGSGRTSRSGGVSPSSSPGVRSSSTSGIASGRNNESSSGSSNNNNVSSGGGNSGSSLTKESFVNGHAGLRPPVSHSSGERYHSQHHPSSHHGQHQRSSSYGAHHHQHPSSLSSHHHHQSGQSSHGLSSHSTSATTGSSSSANNKLSSQQYRENLGIKSYRKSHSSSPLQSDVKPENLAALSNLSNIQNLLNLASLGSLAALQQSLPGLLSSVSGGSSGATRAGSPGNNGSGSSPCRTSPHTGGVGGSSSSPSAAATSSGMHAPLNLTHSSGGGLAPSSSKSHHLPHHHHQVGGGHSTSSGGTTSSINSSSNNHSSSHHSSSSNRGQHSSSPFPHHQSAFSHANSLAAVSGSGVNSSSMLGGGGGGGLIPPNLAAYFSQAAAVAAGTGGRSGSTSSQFIPNSSQLTNSLSHAAASVQSPGSLPQLVLASGHIMQGIQGAQLLIPTSQGIMTQMILTIPLTQPGSPQLNSSAQNTASPAIGAASGQSSSSPHSRSARSQGRSHHHGLPHCSTNSPPIASTVPPSASPDYSGPGGTMPGSLLNLSPHLVNQSLGAHIPLDKMGMDRAGGINGVRSSSMKRDNTGSVISPNPNIPMSALYPPKMSPCSEGGHESDKCSEGGDSDQMVDGINLDEIKEFAKAFKLRRLSLGLTQTQVGQALSVTEGPAYSQSAICSALAWQLAQSQSQLSQSNRTSLPQPSMFEKLDITPKSAQKIKPVLERWMKEAEDRYKNGHQNLNEFVGMEPSKKRKRRTSFTPQALEILNTQFERNTHPSGAEITTLAHQLGYEREVIRIWFCNKRQALKNTVRMMSKGSSPI